MAVPKLRTSDSGPQTLPAPKRQRRFRLLALRGLTVVIGCLGLAFGFSNLLRGEASDDFRDLESRLLQFETFTQATTTETLASAAAWDLSPCDNHAQRALLLMEIPLADAALRSGAVHEYDERIRSLESRARQALNCTPRDSFVWLVLFGLETGHGTLDEHAFDLLAMSYETSPNEAWIATRRAAFAIPVVLSAPEAMQQRILSEFQTLVRNGYAELPARAYLRASGPARALLQSRIEELDAPSQKTFAYALQKLRS
jgi:hypothetical protein